MFPSSKVNPDLQEERNKVTFNVEEFTNWYYEGEQNVSQKRFLGKLNVQGHYFCSNFHYFTTENCFLNDPELKITDMSYLSHNEKYEEAIRRATVLYTKIKTLQVEGHVGNELFKYEHHI